MRRPKPAVKIMLVTGDSVQVSDVIQVGGRHHEVVDIHVANRFRKRRLTFDDGNCYLLEKGMSIEVIRTFTTPAIGDIRNSRAIQRADWINGR